MMRLLFLFVFTSFTLYANAGKRINLVPTEGMSIYKPNMHVYDYSPGDTLYFNKSCTSVFMGRVEGTIKDSVVITAAPGVIIYGEKNRGIDINGSKYFKIVNLNLFINYNVTALACHFNNHFRITNVNIMGRPSLGIQVKNNPQDGKPETYYPAIIEGVQIDNCHVRGTVNEAYYIGHTFSQPLYNQIPSPIIGLKMYNIKADSCGWDGLQINNSQNVDVNNVVVDSCGISAKPGQSFGVIIGSCTVGKYSNIRVSNSGGSGFATMARGYMLVDRLTINMNLASLPPNVGPIFIDNRSDQGLNLPPLQLDMRNVTLLGRGKGKARLVYNINGKLNGAIEQLPGKISNLSYNEADWPEGIVDPVNTYRLSSGKELMFKKKQQSK